MKSDKKALRSELNARLQSLPAVRFEEAEEKIFLRLKERADFFTKKRIAAYWSMPKELSLKLFIEDSNNDIVLPRIQGSNLTWHRFEGIDSLVPEGKFGILEPVGEVIEESSIDICLCPGLGFTESGDRLGRGKGFYDRFLSKNSLHCIGVCLREQLLPSIPMEAHDRKMDEVYAV